MTEHPEQPEHEQAAEQSAADGPSDPRLAEAVARLQGLAEKPPEEHVEVYEDVHRALQQSLSDAQADRPQS